MKKLRKFNKNSAEIFKAKNNPKIYGDLVILGDRAQGYYYWISSKQWKRKWGRNYPCLMVWYTNYITSIGPHQNISSAISPWSVENRPRLP